MQQYEEFLKRIKKYFEYDEVITQGNIINAYDLIQVLKSRISELHNLIFENKDIIKKIDNYYKGEKILDMLIRRVTRLHIPKVKFINQNFENNHARIYISFNYNTCQNLNYDSLEICKERGTNELFFADSDVDKEFAEYFKDIILPNLQALEEFFDLYRLTIPDIKEIPSDFFIKEVVDDEFLKLQISYNAYGSLNYEISIVSSVDTDDIFERIWFDHSSLKEIVEENKVELLKRIPINILDLKDTTQKIITDYYAKNNTNEHRLELK